MANDLKQGLTIVDVPLVQHGVVPDPSAAFWTQFQGFKVEKMAVLEERDVAIDHAITASVLLVEYCAKHDIRLPSCSANNDPECLFRVRLESKGTEHGKLRPSEELSKILELQDLAEKGRQRSSEALTALEELKTDVDEGFPRGDALPTIVDIVKENCVLLDQMMDDFIANVGVIHPANTLVGQREAQRFKNMVLNKIGQRLREQATSGHYSASMLASARLKLLRRKLLLSDREKTTFIFNVASKAKAVKEQGAQNDTFEKALGQILPQTSTKKPEQKAEQTTDTQSGQSSSEARQQAIKRAWMHAVGTTEDEKEK